MLTCSSLIVAIAQKCMNIFLYVGDHRIRIVSLKRLAVAIDQEFFEIPADVVRSHGVVHQFFSLFKIIASGWTLALFAFNRNIKKMLFFCTLLFIGLTSPLGNETVGADRCR